ncbi:MAG: peptidylprolyl isomerase [Vallitalea sp.]|jgi:peptidyl-prolyl cis-trans isomerase B (cyclophilin B)|nr:peptidylprolyl isomerase [Vallitalea sp.]
MRKISVGLILTILLLSACSNKVGQIEDGYTNFGDLKFPQFQRPKEGEEIAVITTSKGVIKAKLLEEAAPIAIKQFKEWVKEGRYTNCPFARLRKDRTIMIEMEGFNNNWNKEERVKYNNNIREDMNFGDDYVIETNEDYMFFSGAIGFAHSTKKDEKEIPIGPLFIVTNEGESEEILELMENLPEEYGFTKEFITAYRDIGGVLEYNGHYIVFAQIFYGMDIVYEISNMTVDGNKYPVEDPVVIEKIEIVKYEEK